MAELKDLSHAIVRIPRFETRMKSFPEIAKTYFEKFVLQDIPLVGQQVYELFSGVCFSFLSLEEQLDQYFEKVPPFELEEALLSGSWSEGLFLFNPKIFDPPDVDFLCILRNISFSEEDQTCGDLSINENSPFVNAYLSDVNMLRLWQSFLVEPACAALEGKICQLSSTKLKERLYKNYSRGDKLFPASSGQYDPVTESPALKLSRGRETRALFHGPFWDILLQAVAFNIWRCSDLVLAIYCDGWLRNALEWIHRERHWPPRDVIEKVSNEGFHIVAKSSHEGNFRLSFSNAEGILVENLSKMQHKLTRAFKAIIKLLVPCNPDSKEVLCSYYLKTVGFWHIEKSAAETWTEDNIASHLLEMLQELVEALRNKNLPMYFIKSYNLFSNVENLLDLEMLSNEVEKISRDLPALTKAVEMGADFHFDQDWDKVVRGVMKKT